jgi:hypothetical protein
LVVRVVLVFMDDVSAGHLVGLPNSGTTGPDGALWFTENAANQIGAFGAACVVGHPSRQHCGWDIFAGIVFAAGRGVMRCLSPIRQHSCAE